MIIDFPTALYLPDPNFPKKPSDVGNVTFEISSTNPPRTSVAVPPLFKSDELRPLPDRIYNPQQRLISLGEFQSTVSYVALSIAASGMKSFEVGEVLEFTSATTNIAELAIPDTIDLVQNTNMIDYAAIGLNIDQVNRIVSQARQEYDALLVDINQTKVSIATNEILVQNNQKLINEVVKTRSAVEGLFGTDDSIAQQLLAKEVALNDTNTALINEINSLTSAAETMYNRLLEIREVVR